MHALQAINYQQKYRFPWRNNNRFRLLIDGSEFYTAMLESFNHARRSILFEMYLFESGNITDRFINAFIAAVSRGVKVYLLLDDYGARGLLSHDKQRLIQGGVHLAFYNPLHYGRFRRSLFRDHRKIIIVDDKVAFTGGAGITDDFDPAQHPRLYWHEIMIEISGANVFDWQTVFIENWNRWSDVKLELPDESKSQNFETAAHFNQSGRVVLSRATTNSEVIRSFIKHIRDAEQRIWLATAYFVPSWKFRRALRHSARQGVDVRLMLPGPHTDHGWVRHIGRRYYERMLRSGVRIFEYKPRFLHAKVLLCDQWASTGSSNVDRWNFVWNLEANQEVHNSEFAEHVAEQLQIDFDDCREFHYEQWRQRPWHRRFLEWFWGQIFTFLSWFSSHKK